MVSAHRRSSGKRSGVILCGWDGRFGSEAPSIHTFPPHRWVPELYECVGPESAAPLLAAKPDAEVCHKSSHKGSRDREVMVNVPSLETYIHVQCLRFLLRTPHSLQALKAAFTALMTCEPGKVQAAVASLIARLKEKLGSGGTAKAEGASLSSSAGGLEAKEALALRLDQQYPGGDVGVFSAFFLNLVGPRRGIGKGGIAGQGLGIGATARTTYQYDPSTSKHVTSQIPCSTLLSMSVPRSPAPHFP